jgi:O-6-methylguanine DNA methyltransferase
MLILLKLGPCRRLSPTKAYADLNSTSLTGKPCFETRYRSGFHRARSLSGQPSAGARPGLVGALLRGRFHQLKPLPFGSSWHRLPERQIWDLLLDIPLGSTVTYGELARKVNRPNGARAVGLAMRRNPVGIIVPCHRVVGRNGSLTGYGGGLDRKRWLLEHECSAAPLFKSVSNRR